MQKVIEETHCKPGRLSQHVEKKNLKWAVCISAVSSSVAVNSITDGEFKDELALAAVLDLVHTGMVQVLVLRFLMNQSCLQSHGS